MWYHTVIEKIVFYAAGIWAKNLSANQTKQLSTLQRPFLLKLTKAYSTAPTSALCVLSQVLPLKIALQREANTQLCLRLGSDIDIRNCTIKHSEIETKQNLLHLHPSLYDVTNIYPLGSSTSANLKIFTDGSKSDEGVASAFVVFTDNTRIYS